MKKNRRKKRKVADSYTAKIICSKFALEMLEADVIDSIAQRTFERAAAKVGSDDFTTVTYFHRQLAVTVDGKVATGGETLTAWERRPTSLGKLCVVIVFVGSGVGKGDVYICMESEVPSFIPAELNAVPDWQQFISKPPAELPWERGLPIPLPAP